MLSRATPVPNTRGWPCGSPLSSCGCSGGGQPAASEYELPVDGIGEAPNAIRDYFATYGVPCRSSTYCVVAPAAVDCGASIEGS